MCSIHGFCWPSEEKINEMLCEAHHRGPDGSDKWISDDITLGHNLLSIVDTVENGKQPFYYEDLILVYNGEIYNYKELQKTLKTSCKTDTDTEVLIRGIKEHGKEFVYKLDGMFAFACYNKTTKELILARDRNGAKPLYWGKVGGKFAFSSEIKSLLKLGFERKVDKEGLGHYYKQGYNSGYLTLFKGIRKFVPGEVMTYNVATDKTDSVNINNLPIPGQDIWNHMKLSDEPFRVPEDFNVLIKQRLHESVMMSLMGRREIGLFLSGGIDSTSIYMEIPKKKDTKCFSTCFDLILKTSRLNEDHNLARKIAEEHRAPFHSVKCTNQEYIDNAEATLLALEEPRQSKSLPSYYVTNKRIKKEGVTVTLSGDGGDEILAGYKHHRVPNWHTKLKALCANHRELKNPDIWKSHNQQIEYLEDWFPDKQIGLDSNEKLNDFMRYECLNTLAEDFLIRNDKLGMAHSMEGRFPMLMNHFKNFVMSIPSAYKVNDSFLKGNWSLHNKPLLKEAYKNVLPLSIIMRGKTGWRFPTDEMLIGNKSHPASDGHPHQMRLRHFVYETLNNPEIMDIFEYTEPMIWDKYLCNSGWEMGTDLSGNPQIKPNEGEKAQKELFTILNFAIWYKVFNMNM